MQETLTEKNTQLMEQQAAIKHLTELVQSMTSKTVAIPAENSDSTNQDVSALDDTSDQSSNSDNNSDTNNRHGTGETNSMNDETNHCHSNPSPKGSTASQKSDNFIEDAESSEPNNESRLKEDVFNTHVTSPARTRKGEKTDKDYGMQSAHSVTSGKTTKSRKTSSTLDPSTIPLLPDIRAKYGDDDHNEKVSIY